MHESNERKTDRLGATVPEILFKIAASIAAITGAIAIVLPILLANDSPIVRSDAPSDREVSSSPTSPSEPANTASPEPASAASPEPSDAAAPEPATPVSIAGEWTWEGVGTMTFQQNGNEVTGVLSPDNSPGTSSLQGNLSGRELTFVWWFTAGPSTPQNPQGKGTLTIDEGDRTMSGTFTDRERGNTSSPWSLQRLSP